MIYEFYLKQINKKFLGSRKYPHFENEKCVRRTTPRIDDSLGELRAMIYYSKKLQSKISEGKGYKEQSPGKTGHRLPASSPSGVTQDTFPQQLISTCMKCCQPQKPIRDSVPRVFSGGWSRGHPLPGMYPNSKLRRKAGVQRKSCCLYKQVRHSEPLLPVNGGNSAQIQVPRCRGQRGKQAFPGRAVRPAVFFLFFSAPFTPLVLGHGVFTAELLSIGARIAG